MASRTLDMTKGRPLPLLFRFALPLMVGNVFQQLYTVVDTMVVGKALGVGALAALGASDWLNWLMLGMIQGLTQGFAVLMAQAFGAREQDQLHRTIGVSTVLCAVSAAVLVLAGQLFLKPVLGLMQTPDEIFGGASIYLRIMFGGIPIVMAYNLVSCILRSLGDSRTPLYAMILACGINIGLDLLFVLVFRWGIPGAAAATLIAQCVSALFCLRQLARMGEARVTKQDFRMHWPLAARLLRLGAAMAFQFLLISVGGLVVQYVVNGVSVAFIAGFTASNKLYGIFEIAATSFGFAVVTFVGQNLGAGHRDRIRQGTWTAVGLAMITSVIVGAVMLLLGKWILSGFISGTPEETEAAMDTAYRYLSIMSLCLPVLYLIYIYRSALQGLENASLPFASGVVELVMRVGAALLLPRLVGESGIFYAEVLAWFGADLVLVPGYFWMIRKWK